jgi:3D-(3,5/4)-trihydroxycyclohexane-1,2-dione acylhydrolase (decyclizing)
MKTFSQKMIRLTMGQALVKFLQVQHTQRDGKTRRLIPALFGILGHGNVSGISQALIEYGAELPFYRPNNEQAMVHTAIGFAKTNRRLATLACTTSIGPGATNMVTGAGTATINRLPVLLLPSDYYATRRQGPVLQQLEHPCEADVSVNDCFRPVSRFFDRISRPEQLLTALPEAMRVLTDPVETGACTLALPQDVQCEAAEYPAQFFEKRVWRIERPAPDAERIREAVALLKAAKRPAMIAGGGIHYSEAYEEAQSFAETFGIPVGESFGGKGSIRNRSELLLGGVGVVGTPAAAAIFAKADLVLSVGSRLNDFITGSHSAFQNPDVKFININVSRYDACKLGALPIVADARETLRALTEAAKAAGIKPNAAYREEVIETRRNWEQDLDKEITEQRAGEALNQGLLIRLLNEHAAAGDTIVSAAGTLVGDLQQIWDVSGGSACHLEFGNSCMGYDLPASLGIRLAKPEGEIFVFLGDGGYLMNPTELVTAFQEHLKITVVISENHGYQSIHGHQRAHVGHSLGNEFRMRNEKSKRDDGPFAALDLAKSAEGFGARAWKARTPDEVKAALKEARAVRGQPCVIVVETEPMRRLPRSGMWWDVAASEVTNDPVTKKLRAAYEEERALQRFYY